MNLRDFRAARRLRPIAFAIAMTAGPLLVGTAHAAPTGDATFDAMMAERLALIADETVGYGDTPEPFLREAAALLDLARESNPKEPRFARSSVDVLLRLGESERALQALGALRALDPKDQLAQIQFIDLSANRLESADAKEAYLQQVVDANGVSSEVRSHAAMSLMDLLYQRSEDARALEMLDKALALNPQNVAALKEKYRLAVRGGDPMERAKTLSALLIASPLDAQALARAARECIAAADYAGAHTFYEQDFSVMINRGQSPPVEDLIDLAGAELLSGTSSDIAPLVRQALTGIKDDGRIYALNLVTKQFDDEKPEDLAPDVAVARGVYLAQLAGVSQLLNHPEVKEMPTTNPAVPMPNVTADAGRLTKEDPGNLRTAYTLALAEMLWFDTYFRAAPVDDSSIAALATLLGDESDPLVVRLQGWKLLGNGQAEEAKVKLAAVADRDGYAKLGLAAALASQGKADEAKAALNDLITARPSGMLAVYLSVAAKRAGLKVEPTLAEQDIARAFNDAKRTVIDMIRNPRAYYLLTAQPVNLSFGYSDPLLARVNIQNIGRVPLAIGPGGYIESRYVVDLSIRGEQPRGLPGVAIGQWTGAVRLLPQQSISQVLRIDRNQAYSFFRTFPTPAIIVSGLVTTNAVTTQKGSFTAAGGQQTTIGSVMERRSAPLQIEAYRQKVIDGMTSASPAERMANLELAASVLPMLTSDKNTSEGAKDVAAQLSGALNKQLAKEPVEEVKAWCTVQRMAATGESTDVEKIAQMNSPQAKAALLVFARSMNSDSRKKLAQTMLETNPDGPIAELARGVMAQPDPPATQPTTAP